MNVPVTGTVKTTQTEYLNLPLGWGVTSDTNYNRYLASYFPWSTDVLVFNSGVGILTSAAQGIGSGPGTPFGDGEPKFIFGQRNSSMTCPWSDYQISIYCYFGPGKDLPSGVARLPSMPVDFKFRTSNEIWTEGSDSNTRRH